MARKVGRKSDRIEQRREEVSRRYLTGETHGAIAKAVGVGIATVRRDLRALRERWVESSLRDFDQARAEELAKLDHLEARLWDQWEQSCEERQRRVVEDKGATATPGRNSRVEATGGLGDPRYTAQILQVVERRCKLLGLDAAQKIAGHDGGPLAPEAKGLAALLEEAKQREATQAGE